MKKILIVMLTLTMILLSGCTTQNTSVDTNNPEYVVSDTYAARGSDGEITYVYVEIQNFDDNAISVTVDFRFALLNLDSLGDGYYGGGRTSGGQESIWDDSYNVEQTVVVHGHDIEKVYYEPRPRSDNKIEIQWDYDISASFSKWS